MVPGCQTIVPDYDIPGKLISMEQIMYDYKKDIDEITKIYREKYKTGSPHIIKNALRYTEGKHGKYMPGGREHHTRHLLRVARQVADWGFQMDIIIAALLHDIMENCGVSEGEIESNFGESVAHIVKAVTELSDRDYSGNPAENQYTPYSDMNSGDKMTEKALYVKIADRMDSLSANFQNRNDDIILKSKHTREVIIPRAMRENAYYLVDVLENLCFNIENPDIYQSISEYTKAGKRKYRKSLDYLREVFDPHSYSSSDRSRYIVRLESPLRSCISIYRQIAAGMDHISRDELTHLLIQNNPALYDVTLIVSDELYNKDSPFSPNELFFQYFTQNLSQKYCLADFRYTASKDAAYFLLIDEIDNRFRFFIRTETEYYRHIYGNIIDDEYALTISGIKKAGPSDNDAEKIKVFKKDDTSMMIDKGASVLDFAFAISNELGYHFSYAMEGESRAQHKFYTRLVPNTKITVVSDDTKKPQIEWFRHVKTRKAIDDLIRYFKNQHAEAEYKINRLERRIDELEKQLK